MNIQKSVTVMDVDCPIVSLKRSSSAPMINEISATMSVTSPSTSAPRDAVSTFNVFSSTPRTRRFSTSSPGSIPRLTPRVSQLRQEECVDVAGREAAHEKEIHSAMQISQSWEDLTLEAEGLTFKESESPTQQLNKADKQLTTKRVFDPLNLNLTSGGPPLCSSPSPTRSGLGQRQCYSPGIHMVNWKNSLSPSPTRKAFATRRSLSPIAIRPSCLGPVKRKFELDDNISDQHLQPPAKRTSSLVMSNSSRLETMASPLPGTISSVGTPESLSSADSPSFSFQTVDSPSPGRVLINGDDPMSDTNDQTKISENAQVNQSGQCNFR